MALLTKNKVEKTRRQWFWGHDLSLSPPNYESDELLGCFTSRFLAGLFLISEELIL